MVHNARSKAFFQVLLFPLQPYPSPGSISLAKRGDQLDRREENLTRHLDKRVAVSRIPLILHGEKVRKRCCFRMCSTWHNLQNACFLLM